MSHEHIIIVGGGIGGLALAQSLKKRGVSFTLFERDSSQSARAQGYRIRVAGSGAEALRECLSEKLWELFKNTCGENKPMGQRLNAVDCSPIMTFSPGPGKGGLANIKPPHGTSMSYAADRTILRSLLLLGQGENVQFGKLFTHYELTHDGVTAFFSDGSYEKGTLLVGADGIASPVRKQLLPHVRYVDSGSRAIYGKTPLSPEFLSRFPSAALQGVTVIQDNSLTLFLEPMRFLKDVSAESNKQLPRTEDYLYWVFGGNSADIGLSNTEFQSLSGKDAAQLTLTLTEHWDSSIRSMFELQTTSQSAPLRLISAKPERPEWTPSSRVTLIGDSIHGMIPAGGSGANCALNDAELLARLISEKGASIEMAGQYIDEMWKYALPLIQGSGEAAQKLLGFKGFEGAREVDF